MKNNQSVKDGKLPVRIHSENKIRKVRVAPGTNLLDIIRETGLPVTAPCGGKGNCGKCLVIINGADTVAACRYAVDKAVEVHLPGSRQMDILTTQYEHTLALPFQPGPLVSLSENPVGLALDLGTTTMVYYLLELTRGSVLGVRSEPNPQAIYGADVISRINYCIVEQTGLNKLQHQLIDAMNRQISAFAADFRLADSDFVKIAVAGNNTLLHILTGTDPSSIALAPFTPVFTNYRIMEGTSLGIRMHPVGEVHLLPSISGYVGADIVSGIASIHMPGIETYLYLDIGTNGELALVSKNRIWCCATAAGPAFEGASISCGTGAFAGAIFAYDKHGYKTIADARPTGICGSGLLDLVVWLLETGKIAPDGGLEEDFLISPAKDNETGQDIFITQQDIREIQLAKGAIAAGIRLILECAGLNPDQVSQVVIAGGFGNYMRIESALRIGLIPAEFRNKVIQVGNASGGGRKE